MRLFHLSIISGCDRSASWISSGTSWTTPVAINGWFITKILFPNSKNIASSQEDDEPVWNGNKNFFTPPYWLISSPDDITDRHRNNKSYPEHKGILHSTILRIAPIIQASEVIIKNVTIISVTSCFHTHFIIFSCSFLLGGFSPQWIFIQSFPNNGPCQNAPPKKDTRVITQIAKKLSCIKKCLKIKHPYYIQSQKKEISTKNINQHLPRKGIQQSL